MKLKLLKLFFLVISLFVVTGTQSYYNTSIPQQVSYEMELSESMSEIDELNSHEFMIFNTSNTSVDTTRGRSENNFLTDLYKIYSTVPTRPPRAF